jgi:hypothetical protein
MEDAPARRRRSEAAGTNSGRLQYTVGRVAEVEEGEAVW